MPLFLLNNPNYPRFSRVFWLPNDPQNLRAALESLALLGATNAALAVSSAAPSSPSASRSATTPATPHQPEDARHAAGLDPQGRSSSSPSKPKPHHTSNEEEEEEDATARQAPTATTTTTTVFEDATARAPLTPLGRVLSALPVDPSVGKMLALGALFGESEHVLTLAAALSTQTPFDARASASASGANPVAEFASPNGVQG